MRSNPYPLGVMSIYFEDPAYNPEAQEFIKKQCNKRGLRAKAHPVDDSPLEDFSLIFKDACKEVANDQNAN